MGVCVHVQWKKKKKNVESSAGAAKSFRATVNARLAQRRQNTFALLSLAVSRLPALVAAAVTTYSARLTSTID